MRQVGTVIFFLFFVVSTPVVNAQVQRLYPFSEKKAARIAEIKKMLPLQPKGYGYPINDRPAWESIKSKANMTEVIALADQYLIEAIPPFDSLAYTDILRTGNRSAGEAMLWNRRKRLVPLVWAECLENKGKYISKIEEVLLDLSGEPSWTLPAHDQNLDNLSGRKYTVDLNAANRARDYAQVLYFLGTELSEYVRSLVISRMYEKVFNPIIQSGENNVYSPYFRIDNWNGVCVSGVTRAALAGIQDVDERAYFASLAEYYGQNTLEGFTSDGYCTEGLAYFNYGFINFISLREILYQNTNGQVDLLSKDPKVKAIAMYGKNIEIMNNIYPSIADCQLGTTEDLNILTYLGRITGRRGVPDFELNYTTPDFDIELMKIFPNSVDDLIPDNSSVNYDLRSGFETVDVYVFRPGANNNQLGVSVKGNNNGEFHNHNDVGSYSIVVNDVFMNGDLGGPKSYYADSFGSERYTKYKTNGSYGHPLPVFGGVYQKDGEAYKGIVLHKLQTDAKEEVVMDLKGAYPKNDLLKAIRTFTYERNDTITFVVKDEFEYESAQYFESALTFKAFWIKKDDNTIEFTDGNRKLYVRIDSKGEPYELIEDSWKENTPDTHKRLAVRFINKVVTGSLTFVFSSYYLGDPRSSSMLINFADWYDQNILKNPTTNTFIEVERCSIQNMFTTLSGIYNDMDKKVLITNADTNTPSVFCFPETGGVQSLRIKGFSPNGIRNIKLQKFQNGEWVPAVSQGLNGAFSAGDVRIRKEYEDFLLNLNIKEPVQLRLYWNTTSPIAFEAFEMVYYEKDFTSVFNSLAVNSLAYIAQGKLKFKADPVKTTLQFYNFNGVLLKTVVPTTFEISIPEGSRLIRVISEGQVQVLKVF